MDAPLPRFARSKIQPPRPRAGSLVARPALEARLREALSAQRLVLLCAAAGYGKTAALARQVETLPAGTALAWVSADPGDDLHRLLECLVAALEPHDPPWRTAPEALVAAAAGAQRAAVAAELVDTLEACEVAHGVIVFDDLHRVDDAAWYDFLDAVLRRLDARWTIVLSGRAEPPLALARLRALGELSEFRQADLRFGRDETHALTAAAGLDDALADTLLERTHGWAAGLRLALNTPRTDGDGLRWTAIDRHVFEFLATEVLDQLDAELRDFLLRCAVLPELSAVRCAAVCGNPRSALLLDEVERRGLFVSVLEPPDASSPPTLQLHDLFREALEHRLQRERPQEIPALLQRAAAGEADPVRRVVLLLRAGRPDDAAANLLACAPALLTGGALATVARLIDRFPAGHAGPQLDHARGLLHWAQWNFVAMVEAMRRAEAGYAALGDADAAGAAAAYRSIALSALGRIDESGPRLAALRRTAMGRSTRVVVLVACLWHALDLGSTHRVGPLLDELMDLVDGCDDLAQWYRAHPIARMNGLPGTARALDRYVEGALRLTEGQPSALRSLALTQRGWRLAWSGDLDGALAALDAARADSHWLGDPPNARGSVQLLSAHVHALRGEVGPALAAAQASIDEHPTGRGDWSLWGVLFYAARIAAACAALPVLQRRLAALQAMRPGAGMQPTHAPLTRALLGHAAALEGRTADAVAAWTEALADEARLDRLGFGLEVRLRLAAALVTLERLDEAAAALRPVFAAVAEHAGVGPVLFARAVLPTLARTAWGTRLGREAPARLAAWAALAPPLGPTPAPLVFAPAPAPAAAADPLSPREREVLERIAAGDSNKLIARAFDLSPHTVKRHVANILDKLGLASRGQAAAWYHDQG